MKAIIEFNLPEEEDQFLEAVNGYNWKSVVQEFDEWMRNTIKHQNPPNISLREVRLRFNNLITEKDLVLY